MRFIVYREDRAVADTTRGLVRFFDALAEAVAYAEARNAEAEQ